MLPTMNRTNDFGSLLDNFFTPTLWNNREGFSREAVPAVNIAEDEKAYRIEVAAPGLKKDDINIDLDENVLTISSEQEDKKEEKEENYTRKEFSYCSFKRSFVLPDNTNKDKIEAHHKDGVLNINIPKEEQKKLTKQIKIS
ncbi:MAG: Hsp20/alpha crystallin family protein [bacterium]